MEVRLVRRSVILAAALAAVAASLVVYRTQRRRARKLAQSTATARWESEGGATAPVGDTDYG
jgi:hypothetical protein